MSKIAQELRELVAELEVAVRRSPAYSVALPISQNYIDHLTALARVYELQQILFEKEEPQVPINLSPGKSNEGH